MNPADEAGLFARLRSLVIDPAKAFLLRVAMGRADKGPDDQRPKPHDWEPCDEWPKYGATVYRCSKCGLHRVGLLHFMPEHKDAVVRDLGPTLLQQSRPDCFDIYERVHVGFPVPPPDEPKSTSKSAEYTCPHGGTEGGAESHLIVTGGKTLNVTCHEYELYLVERRRTEAKIRARIEERTRET